MRIFYLTLITSLWLFLLSSTAAQDTSHPVRGLSDDALLDLVQEHTFQYFWDGAEPNSGMARERYHADGIYPRNDKHIVTTGGSGFGLMAIVAGIERGFITRGEGVERFERIVSFLETADRFHGVWPHWLDGETGRVSPFSRNDDGADLVETSFLIQGLLAVKQYLIDGNAQERSLADRIDKLWREVQWDWHRRDGENVLYWHWSPNFGWEKNHQIRGYNECVITYVLAASSPTYPIPPEVYHEGWARNGEIKTNVSKYGHALTLNHNRGRELGGPLFWAHYSYLGLDPRNLVDDYANYWEHNVNHTKINREYCIENPHGNKGYGRQSWGLTSSYSVRGYAAHSPINDRGVISPTAALSSFPYTPEYSMEAMRYFYEELGDRLFGKYGFYDAFSETEDWFIPRYLAIDQSPIVVMIENYRSGLLWDLFMRNPEIANGLEKLGFTSMNIPGKKTITGRVFHDTDGSGSFTPDVDIPLAGIAVSNGRDIVITDDEGRYALSVGDHSIIFVVKPADWSVPVDSLQIPRFYHIHNMAGATGERYEGLPPQPPIPASVDFPLYPVNEPDRFELIVFADTQSRNTKELHYLMNDAIADLTGTEAAFGVTLGDLVFDDLNLLGPYNEVMATIGIPWIHLIGNHDIDFSANDNTSARGAYFRHYGPSYYAFSYGKAHFLVLDNIRFIIDGDNRYYRPGLSEDHMVFIENELARIDKDKLLVVLMHIPWDDAGWDRRQRDHLLQMLSEHPNSLSLGAHWHRHYHRFLGSDYGLTDEQPHHMISMGAVCGAWWRGLPDEYGIPHALMGDGTPTGYGVLNVNGKEARLSWQSSRRPANFQMHIDVPDHITMPETEGLVLSANIFNAMPDAKVMVQVGNNGPWLPMEYAIAPDPVKVRSAEFEKHLTDQLGSIPWTESRGASNSFKLWQMTMEGPLPPGTHLISVRAEDRWAVYEGKRIIRVSDRTD